MFQFHFEAEKICNKVCRAGEWPISWTQCLIISLPTAVLELQNLKHQSTPTGVTIMHSLTLFLQYFLEKIITGALALHGGKQNYRRSTAGR